MSETELSVVCKNCGSEVSPYVTECPYCGARIRKRAPKLERRGDALEPKASRRRRRRPRLGRSPVDALDANRPWATIFLIAASAVLLLVQEASGYEIYAGLGLPFDDDPWRYLTAPFAYDNSGYWFIASIGLLIFGTGVERRLGTAPTLILLVACGALGSLGAYAIEDALDGIGTIAGGNGMALGALATWYAMRRAEARGAADDEVDVVGVAVCAGVLLALPIFESSASVFAGLIGGAVGGLAGLAAARLRPAD
ncbi:MAG TPA: rhomboid family intramembrane serine protease [Solirubrobacterales bacterium]|nr:rhomboid family intramembrane serine protease [Solirubrobacterales bacterium]